MQDYFNFTSSKHRIGSLQLEIHAKAQQMHGVANVVFVFCGDQKVTERVINQVDLLCFFVCRFASIGIHFIHSLADFRFLPDSCTYD